MCKWKSKYRDYYECPESHLPNDPKGYCILHSPDKGKPPEEFTKKVEERMNQGRYYYRVAEDLPPGFSDRLTDKISYDSSRKLLVYSGVMSEDERDSLLNLSGDSEYRRAIWNLFKSSRNEPIDLVGCHFPGGFIPNYFSGYPFERPVDFTEATFSQGANFSGAEFSQGAYFSGAQFLKNAIFDGATFAKRTSFYKTEFRGRAHFLEATFSGVVEFLGVLFNGYADFQEATFCGLADFYCTFRQEAKFSKAKFQKADFSGTDFCGMVEFSESRFEGDADFTGIIFKETSKEAEFKDVVFYTEANFSASYWLHTKLDFTGTIFKERVLFTPRLPSRPTQGMEVGSAIFNTVSFLGECIFQGADLSQVSFLHSNIDKVDFRYCEFAEKPERFLWFNLKPRKNVLKDELDADGSVRHSERSEESRPFVNAQGDKNKKLGEERY